MATTKSTPLDVPAAAYHYNPHQKPMALLPNWAPFHQASPYMGYPNEEWQGIGHEISANVKKMRRVEEVIKADPVPSPSSSASTKVGFEAFTSFNDNLGCFFTEEVAEPEPEPEHMWLEMPAPLEELPAEVYESAPSYSSSEPPSSSAAAAPTRPLTKYLRKCSSELDDASNAQRPTLSEAHLKELNDLTGFRTDDQYKSMIVDYHDGISFPLGEGGRELLRACLNVKGCKGRQLQGASVPALLHLAKHWGLWDVAIRIKCERSTGRLSPFHEKFVKFKANQSLLRKTARKEYMECLRDDNGKIVDLIYNEDAKLVLGKEGREYIRGRLRRLHDEDPVGMDQKLSEIKCKYSELRNATVKQLCKMAHNCALWHEVIAAVRRQEQKREGRRFHEEGTESENSDPPEEELEVQIEPEAPEAEEVQLDEEYVGELLSEAPPAEIHVKREFTAPEEYPTDVFGTFNNEFHEPW